jgi:hypothetical protein
LAFCLVRLFAVGAPALAVRSYNTAMTAEGLFWAKGHAKHRESFTSSLLDRGDDLAAVVRAQVFVEYYLREAIESALIDKAALGRSVWNSALTFDVRLKLFRAVGGELTDALAWRIKRLGEIRNQLAHTLGASVAQEAAVEFMSHLNAAQKAGLSAMEWPRDGWRREFRIALWVHVIDVRFACAVLKTRYEALRPELDKVRTLPITLQAESLGRMPFGLFAPDYDSSDEQD